MAGCLFFIQYPIKYAGIVLLFCIKTHLHSLNQGFSFNATVPALIRPLPSTASKTPKISPVLIYRHVFSDTSPKTETSYPPLIPNSMIKFYFSSSASGGLNYKPVRLDLFAADVKELSLCSLSTAHRRIKQCRDALDKKDHQPLTILEFCNYYGYDYYQVLKQLNLLC